MATQGYHWLTCAHEYKANVCKSQEQFINKNYDIYRQQQTSL